MQSCPRGCRIADPKYKEVTWCVELKVIPIGKLNAGKLQCPKCQWVFHPKFFLDNTNESASKAPVLPPEPPTGR